MSGWVLPAAIAAQFNKALQLTLDPAAAFAFAKSTSASSAAELKRYTNRLPQTTVTVIIWDMIRSFRDKDTEAVFDGLENQAARRCCPRSAWAIARRKLDQINRVREVSELSVPPGNRLERLRGNRKGQYSIRTNQQFRICFKWEEGHAFEVEITDYH